MEKLCGIATENMMYRVGSPLPVPPGYEVEPFIVVGIIMVEEGQENPSVEDTTGDAPAPEEGTNETSAEAAEEEPDEVRSQFMVFAVPDPEEVKRGPLPTKCPTDQDPEIWPKAVKYNSQALVHENAGHRIIATVDPAIVVRVERLVDPNEFVEIIRSATEGAKGEGAEGTA